MVRLGEVWEGMVWGACNGFLSGSIPLARLNDYDFKTISKG